MAHFKCDPIGADWRFFAILLGCERFCRGNDTGGIAKTGLPRDSPPNVLFQMYNT